MKTAEEKAKEDFRYLLNQFYEGLQPENINKNDFVNFLTGVRKRQDRDTRHACAEAVENLTPPEGGIASRTCMNVKAV